MTANHHEETPSGQQQPTSRHKRRHERLHAPPFWQADRPYLHEHHISDFSMWLEAVYLLIFGLFGLTTSKWNIGDGNLVFPSLALFLMCFIMGMHNTVMTLLSGGAIRSTHMTGTATDLGIELSRALYYSKKHHPRLPHVHVNKPKMWLLNGLMWAFLLGGVVGAWGYHKIGHHFALPVSAVLFILGAGSVGYDVKVRLKFALAGWYRRHRAKQR